MESAVEAVENQVGEEELQRARAKNEHEPTPEFRGGANARSMAHHADSGPELEPMLEPQSRSSATQSTMPQRTSTDDGPDIGEGFSQTMALPTHRPSTAPQRNLGEALDPMLGDEGGLGFVVPEVSLPTADGAPMPPTRNQNGTGSLSSRSPVTVRPSTAGPAAGRRAGKGGTGGQFPPKENQGQESSPDSSDARRAAKRLGIRRPSLQAAEELLR